MSRSVLAWGGGPHHQQQGSAGQPGDLPSGSAPWGLRHGLPSRGSGQTAPGIQHGGHWVQGAREVFLGKKGLGSCHDQVRSKWRVGILDRGTDRCKGREKEERAGLPGNYRRLPGTPRTGSIRPRGRWATSVRTVVGELMLPKTEIWTPSQAQPGALPLDGQEEAAGSAEDRLWPFVLTPREVAVLHGTTQLAPVLGRRPWHWRWRGGPTLTGPLRARC